MNHDLRFIHGSLTAKLILALFDSGELNNGDKILLPQKYQIIYSGQSRPDLYKAAMGVQCYVSCVNYA